MNGKLFFGGMSTDTELGKLMDIFSEAVPGTLITHDEIESAIGVRRDSNRYWTVLTRWKRAMFSKCNLEVASRKGEGYVVMTPAERVQKASDDTRKINNEVRRVHYRFAAIPRSGLSDQDIRRADHSQIALAKLCDDMASARKTIEAPTRPEYIGRPT
jgi:hypothetical protein